MIRAVVFDCDGVLVDSEPHSAAAWMAVLGSRGHRATTADVADCTGLGYAATYEHLAAVDPSVALPPPEALWPEVQAALAASFDRGLKVFADAAACVTDLAFAGVPLAVASQQPAGAPRPHSGAQRPGPLLRAVPRRATRWSTASPPRTSTCWRPSAWGWRPRTAWPWRTPGMGPPRRWPPACEWWVWRGNPAEAGRLLGAGAALVNRLDPWGAADAALDIASPGAGGCGGISPSASCGASCPARGGNGEHRLWPCGGTVLPAVAAGGGRQVSAGARPSWSAAPVAAGGGGA